MKKQFNLLVMWGLSLAIAMLMGLSSVNLAVADDKRCGDVKTSTIDCGDIQQENQIIYLLKRAVTIMYGLIGVTAVVMIIAAGVLYTTAGDSEEQVRKAKGMIKNTVLGILLFMFMTMILEFLIPGGVFR